MRKGRSAVLVLSAFLAFSTSPYSLFAKQEAKERVAHVSGGGSVIQWTPTIDHDRLLLTVVAPDGTIIEKAFNSGNNPSFRASDAPNRMLADGIYTWELRVEPKINASVKRQLAAAREADDDAAVARILAANGIGETVTQSGGFRVANGAFVSPEAAEPTAKDSAATSAATSSLRTARSDAGSSAGGDALRNAPVATDDTVIAGNESVQGSLCVGFDCASTETYGFETIKLKENNLRILFDDTSSSAGFPNVDWQLTANDSASGGLNRFSIDDVTNSKTIFNVEAAATANSIYIASSGKVGFRTSSPALPLHVKVGDTPGLRLEQDTTSGFTAQTWDVGGNEANFFVRDLTGGSKLPFRIRPGAPTSTVDISAAGNVGINNASPTVKLHIINDGGTIRMQHSTASSYSGLEFYEGTTQFATIASLGSTSGATGGPNALQLFTVTSGPIVFGTANAERARIDTSGNLGLGVTNPTNPIQHSSGALLTSGGVWTNASSRDFKQDITELSSSEAMCALEDLQPVKYAYKVDPNERHVGFIAEDVPDLVASQNRKSLSPMDIVAVLTKVVKEQQSTIDQLQHRLDQLEQSKQQ